VSDGCVEALGNQDGDAIALTKPESCECICQPVRCIGELAEAEPAVLAGKIELNNR
jgi:hypothetical protein